MKKIVGIKDDYLLRRKYERQRYSGRPGPWARPNEKPIHISATDVGFNYICRLNQIIMSFEVVGKFIVKYDTVQRSETFKTREFVIEKSEDSNGRSFTSYIKFQCVQDKTAIPDNFNIGDEVKVLFNIKGTKWVKDGREN